MKTVSLKIDSIFGETEKILQELVFLWNISQRLTAYKVQRNLKKKKIFKAEIRISQKDSNEHLPERIWKELTMQINQYEIWIADLNPQKGTRAK
jgi:hypothetical protein